MRGSNNLKSSLKSRLDCYVELATINIELVFVFKKLWKLAAIILSRSGSLRDFVVILKRLQIRQS